MDEIELKPCPFCGGEARMRHWRRLGEHYEVRCATMACGNLVRTWDYSTPEAAAEAWNRREGGDEGDDRP